MVDSKAWAFLRAYILDYVVGILWILPAIVAFTTTDRVAAVAGAIKTTKIALGTVTMTDFVIGFLTVVAGVVVPYCAAMLITPSSYLITGFLFGLQELVWRKHRQADAQLQAAVVALWKSPVKEVPISDRTKIMLLRNRNAEAADDLSANLDALTFKGQVLLPTALLLACVLWRLGFTAGHAAIIGVVVFLIGDIAANGNAATWRRRLHIALLTSMSDVSPAAGSVAVVPAATIGDHGSPRA
jgi:hypothetical protein